MALETIYRNPLFRRHSIKTKQKSGLQNENKICRSLNVLGYCFVSFSWQYQKNEKK